jgi:RNA polymerase sigma-70 factor (ECF subfamily)
MPAERPFEELLSCLRRGDPEAARQLFQRYARRLTGLAARLPAAVRAKDGPEDVVQSVFRTFFRRQAESRFDLDGWDSLWQLLAAIKVNKCGHRVGRFLAARRDVRREQPAPAGDSCGGAWQPADPAPGPAEALLLQETLQEVLDGLPERERPAVLLRLQGYAVAEIARELRCSERTVLRHLEAVRGRLAERAQAE